MTARERSWSFKARVKIVFRPVSRPNTSSIFRAKTPTVNGGRSRPYTMPGTPPPFRRRRLAFFPSSERSSASTTMSLIMMLSSNEQRAHGRVAVDSGDRLPEEARHGKYRDLVVLGLGARQRDRVR